MGFFDAIDNAFGDGTALGAIEGFEEKQYDISEEQKALDKAYKKQLSGAARGLGDVMKKRKAFNEQVSTFSAALSNDPSLKDKLKDLGPEGIRKLARSALNTRYAEGGARGSKFRTIDLISQVRKTDKSALDERFKVTEAETRKEDKKKDSTRSGGLFGNFANILSPTGAGQERRRVARENLVKQFPDATEEDIANAIATSGTSAGSTNDLKTDTPFSVGVPLGIGENEQFAEQAQSVLQDLTNNTMDPKSREIPSEAAAARLKTEEISNLLLQRKYYSVGDNSQQNADITELFTAFYNNNNLLSVYNINDIRGLLRSNKFNVTEYLELLRDKLSKSTPPRPTGPVTQGTPLNSKRGSS